MKHKHYKSIKHFSSLAAVCFNAVFWCVDALELLIVTALDLFMYV